MGTYYWFKKNMNKKNVLQFFDKSQALLSALLIKTMICITKHVNNIQSIRVECVTK